MPRIPLCRSSILAATALCVFQCLSIDSSFSCMAQNSVTSSVQAKYTGKLAMMKNNTCGQKLMFNAAGILLPERSTKFAEECKGMRIRQISMTNEKLVITAQRVPLLFDCAASEYREVLGSAPKPDEPEQAGKEASAGQEVSIDVLLPPNADETVTMGLMEKIFDFSRPGPSDGIRVAANGITRVGNGVSPPVPIFTPDPDYSEEARAAGYDGTVTMIVIVGSDGKVHNARISRALGKGLDEKAIEKVKTWRFKSATRCGEPVAVEVRVEVEFHLRQR